MDANGANKKDVSGEEAMLDSIVEQRDRTSRAFLGVLTIVSVVLGSFLLGSIFGLIGMILSITLAGILVAAVIPWISVYVPYTWGLVAENSFSGEPVVYGSGWHWSFPWEQVTEESNISLEERTYIREDLTMATTSDEMKVKISFQWRPNLKNLATFRRMDDSTVEKGFFEPLERFVSTLFSMMTADQARKNQSVMTGLAFKAFKNKDDKEALAEIAEDNPLRDVLMEELKQFRKHVENLEDNFGIRVVQVNISDVDFSDEVKKARAALAEHNPMMKLYYELAGGTEELYNALSAKEKADVRAEARVISGNATEKQLNIRGNTVPNLIVNADD